MGKVQEVLRDAPTHRQTLAGTTAPDGSERYGFFSHQLKEQRKSFFKFWLLVSYPPHTV